MNNAIFTSTFLKFLLFVFSSLSLGSLFIRKHKLYKIEELGMISLLGVGMIGYSTLIVGLVGLFKQNILLSILITAILINIKGLGKVVYSFIIFALNLLKTSRKSPIALIIISLIIVVSMSLYLSSLQPPYAADELHYHLPQVREIILTKKIDLSFGGHTFYGNLPKQMEIIFALASVIGTYNLSHTFNFWIFISFLAIVFGIVKRHSNTLSALISVLLILFFDDLTWNAITGYVDTATLCYEISALMVAIDWVITKKQNYRYISATLLGFGLSIKYSPLPTALFILIYLYLNKINVKDIFKYSFYAILTGGFWYIKNTILFANPFYPLYFGHKGYPDIQYTSLINAIRQFGPKTPSYFFTLTKRYLTINGFLVFLGLYMTPLSFLFQKRRIFFNILACYSLLYTFYWFVISSHQIRFLMPALVVSLIVISEIFSRLNIKRSFILFVLIAIFMIPIHNYKYRFNLKRIITNFWNTKTHLVERQYALGHVDGVGFLTQKFGCQYLTIRYLEDNQLEGKVIDNWSVWHAPSVSFYATKNKFQTYGFDLTKNSESDLMLHLKNADVKYLYFNQKVKEKHLQNPNPNVIESKKDKIEPEEYIIKNSKLIYQNGDCYLYQIQ